MKGLFHILRQPPLLLSGLICLAGCALSGSADQSQDGCDLRIVLSAKSLDLRYTYFILEKDGQLLFGGGRDAAHRIAHPVTVLSPAQKDELRQIIDEHHLLADERIVRQDPQQIRYEAKIAGGGLRRSIRCVDDQVPGVKALHDKLFQFQAQVRYPSSTTPWTNQPGSL